MLRTLIIIALVGYCFAKPEVPVKAIRNACSYADRHLVVTPP